MFGVFNRPSLPLIVGSSTAGPLCSVPLSGLSSLLRAPPPPSHERPFPFRLSGHPLLSRGFPGTCDGFSSSHRLPFSRASSITPLASPLTVLGFRADSAFAIRVTARPPGFALTRLLVSSLALRPAISLIRPRRTLSIGFKRILLRLPGLCNRREHREEEAGGFFDEKRESVAVTTVERFEEEKVPDSSSNAASYCKIRV
jgi:hypothetical protein